MSIRVLKRTRLPRCELEPEGPSFMTRDEALAALAIKASTLYTYVSRGLIRSIATDGSRQRLFSRVDVEELMVRSMSHEGGAARAQSAMRYGEPIITTNITNITSEGPIYRGYSAIGLARAGVTFEAVAHLLWQETLIDKVIWPATAPSVSPDQLVAALQLRRPSEDILKLFSMIVLALGLPTAGLRQQGTGATIASAQEIIQTLASCTGFLGCPGKYCGPRSGDTIAMTIARALNATELDATASLINAALILCADMELTPGTFAARIAASAGSDVYACVAAGLSAHAGGRGGRGADCCEDFLVGNEHTVEQKLELARRQGQRLPGFYNRILPEGDPRAEVLIDLVKETVPLSRQVRDTLDLIERVEMECDVHAGIAAALVVMTVALGLPRRTATGLWALGRIAGQVAHISEQRSQGFLIRPRAKYETSCQPADGAQLSRVRA
jgi:citrate synthase